MKTIIFLDDDHVVKVARTLMLQPSASRDEHLRQFFAPEPVDLEALNRMATGLRDTDGVRCGLASDIPLHEATAIVFRRGAVDEAMLAACPALRLVQRLGAGAEGIDVSAAHARDVQVSCLPRPTLAMAAEHTLALMLALTKKLLIADASVRRGPAGEAGQAGSIAYNWTGLSGIGGLDGRTLGIVGMGEIGRLVARRAQAFGMRVIYNDRHALPANHEEALGARWCEIAELMAQADYVSIHVPNTPDNHSLINSETLSLMREGAFLINTSRGALVDEDALYDALASNRIAGAALDVHVCEPRPPDRFCALRNVVLTPHIAGGSRLAVLREIGAIFENIREAFAGRTAPHARIPPDGAAS